MLLLSALPSGSVALVVTRSATLGMKDGVSVSLGIVCGDLLFVTFAILGMTLLAETMGAFFSILKILGGTYLIWIGMGLLTSREGSLIDSKKPTPASILTSFLSGLLLTLGDVKAILFYASLFPAFVDMVSLTTVDIAMIMVITALTVGSIKITYALLARRIVSGIEKRAANGRMTKLAAGGLMIGTGGYLLTKA